MRIAAFSTATGAKSVERATGVKPVTFPPLTLNQFDPRVLEGYDILYFHLHGLPNQSYWYGDRMLTAMSVVKVLEARLKSGCVVFAANCHGRGSKMESAFLQAGAGAFVAGSGTNYAVRFGVVRGADLLGAHFVRALLSGCNVAAALAVAKQRIQGRASIPFIGHPERDALEFQIAYRHTFQGV